jgi:hypothetical protein
VSAALALAALALSAPAARAALADRVGATFALMLPEFLKAFQAIEGMVVAVDGEEIFLDVHAGTGAQVGQEYTVFRKGDAFHHPLTGRPLGRYETVLGHAQVRRVYEQFAVGVFVSAPERPRPAPEDGVRITAGRIRVAVAPALDLTGPRADLRRVPYLIATMLERSKRFQVVDPITVVDMFASGGARVEEILARPERAARRARNLEIAGWIIPLLLERGGVTYLDATYISAVTGTALLSRRLPLVAPAGVEEQRFPWEPRAED